MNKQLKTNGFIGGVQTGYNYQIKHWVSGVISDFAYMGLNKKYTSGVVRNAVSGNTYIVDAAYRTNWLFTLRPRLGYGLRWALPYVTGGFATVYETYTQTITQQNLTFTEKGELKKSEIGWTVGGGLDLALAKRWQLMAEYLYLHLRSGSSYSVGSIANYNATHSVQLNAHTVRAGINYVFN